MDIIRKELAADQVYPANLRYNDATDTVQYSPDGGTTWIDSPQNDLRLVNQYPPPDTADPQCDGAARMIALLKDIEASNEAGLQQGAAAAEIATAALLILAFIPLIGVLTAVLGGVAAQLIVVGYAAVHTAFDGFDWDGLTCVLKCLLRADGFIEDGGLASLKDYITSTYTSNQQTVLLGILSYTGRGGLNDAAAVRAETGDCAACDACGWCYLWDAAHLDDNWARTPGGIYGTYTIDGWTTNDALLSGVYRRSLDITLTFPTPATVKHVDVLLNYHCAGSARALRRASSNLRHQL